MLFRCFDNEKNREKWKKKNTDIELVDQKLYCRKEDFEVVIMRYSEKF